MLPSQITHHLHSLVFIMPFFGVVHYVMKFISSSSDQLMDPYVSQVNQNQVLTCPLVMSLSLNLNLLY